MKGAQLAFVLSTHDIGSSAMPEEISQHLSKWPRLRLAELCVR